MKAQLAAVAGEIDPKRLKFGFTHRVRHDRAPGIAAIC
jgi:hypothetical protein